MIAYAASTVLSEASPSTTVALIAAGASIVTAFLTTRNSKKITETHKQVTVNHHSSDFPTVLDRIDDVRTAVLSLGKDVQDVRAQFNDHVAHSNEMDIRLMGVESDLHLQSLKDELTARRSESRKV